MSSHIVWNNSYLCVELRWWEVCLWIRFIHADVAVPFKQNCWYIQSFVGQEMTPCPWSKFVEAVVWQSNIISFVEFDSQSKLDHCQFLWFWGLLPCRSLYLYPNQGWNEQRKSVPGRVSGRKLKSGRVRVGFTRCRIIKTTQYFQFANW